MSELWEIICEKMTCNYFAPPKGKNLEQFARMQNLEQKKCHLFAQSKKVLHPDLKYVFVHRTHVEQSVACSGVKPQLCQL